MNELNKKENSLVTIAIPVFNGDKYLEKTIESIINQDYKKIEILISDNYSLDNTEKICRYYSKLDNRIKYIKQEKNIGAINNFICLLEKANGKYFSWCAADDKFLSKNLISKSLVSLEKYNCEVCIPAIKLMDENGLIKYNLLNHFKSGISSRFSRLLSILKNYHPIYSLYKTDTLRKYINFYKKHNNLKCFNEGLFMIAMYTNINSYYDKSISRAYRIHKSNISRLQNQKDLISSFIEFVSDSMKYIFHNERLKIYRNLYNSSIKSIKKEEI